MTIKIYKPAKTAMQSGVGKTKKWLAEYISDEETVKDHLMGWNTSIDTKTQIKVFLIQRNKQLCGQRKMIIIILSKNLRSKK